MPMKNYKPTSPGRRGMTVSTFEDFKKYINKIIYHMDYPVVGPGVFPQFMLCKLINENNIKVVLGGQ